MKFAKQGGNKLRVGQKRGLVPERRTWTRPSGDYRVKGWFFFGFRDLNTTKFIE